ncbi:hypothetical protein H0H93_016432 [Arthromyces matolae]|nr:hypothetical protein H0H93_016432 [Arthromyces matolae]
MDANMYPRGQWSNDAYRRYYNNPDVYIPPPGNASAYDYRVPQIPRSIKYPDLLFLLASDMTRLQWDVRYKPDSIHASTYFQYRHAIATQKSAKKLKIISKVFPWSIDIDSHVPISAEMVWEAIYQGLQVPIADSEWGMLLMMKKAQKEALEKAAKKRMEEHPEDKEPLRRVDFLGDATKFKGLDRDEEFVKQRALPGSGVFNDTWVVSLKP